MNPDREKEEDERGLQAMYLCAQLAKYQLDMGRIFAIEHPSSASSWELESLRLLSEHPDVRVARLCQCMYGLTVGNRGPAKKPTAIISNSPELLAHCQRRCSGGHFHEPLLGGAQTSAAEKFPAGLISSLASGVEDGAWALCRASERLESFAVGDSSEGERSWTFPSEERDPAISGPESENEPPERPTRTLEGPEGPRRPEASPRISENRPDKEASTLDVRRLSAERDRSAARQLRSSLERGLPPSTARGRRAPGSSQIGKGSL
eukprot:9226785-Pyramimonas_sp.AAC.1